MKTLVQMSYNMDGLVHKTIIGKVLLIQVEPINFSINGSVFTLDVYTSSINTPVLLKLEAPDAGVFIEQLQFTSTSDNWEQLTYDFGDSLTDNLYTKVVLFFAFAPENYGTQIETSTFYVDNIDQLNSQEVLINHLENEIAALQSDLNSCSASEVTTENIPLDLPTRLEYVWIYMYKFS